MKKFSQTDLSFCLCSIFWHPTHTQLLAHSLINSILSEQNSSLETLWSTVEPVDLVQKAYPNLVSNYLDTISAKTKKSSKAAKNKDDQKPLTKTSRVKKSGNSQDIIISDEENVDSEKLKKPKKRSQHKDDGKSKQIDNYFKKVKTLLSIATPIMQQKTQPPKSKHETQSPKIETCSTPLSLTQLSFDFDNSTDNIHDLSDIIHGIVSKSPTIRDLCGKNLHYECVAELLEPMKVTDRDEKDETTDEFDFIVAGMKPISTETNTPTSRKKYKKRSVDKRLPSKSVADLSPSTTPILIKKFFKRNCIDHKPSVMTSSTPTISPKTSPQNLSFESIFSPKENEANVSYFFGDITEENDAFEKLVDFRNMKDEVEANNEDDIACHDCDELQDANDSPPIELGDTFDLDNYVPVGANLRKRLAA